MSNNLQKQKIIMIISAFSAMLFVWILFDAKLAGATIVICSFLIQIVDYAVLYHAELTNQRRVE